MLIGHYAPGLFLKRAAPSIPLWALFVANQFLDLLWGPFVLLGIERCRIVPGFTQSNALDLYYMPWSHSLLFAILWSLLAGGLAAALRPQWGARGRVFAIIALAVFSHWLTDLVVHAEDLPLMPGGVLLGFGLWRSLPAALTVETGLVLAGLLLVPRLPRGWILWVSMPTLCVISYFMATPPSPPAVVMSGLGIYLVYALLARAAETPSQRGSAQP